MSAQSFESVFRHSRLASLPSPLPYYRYGRHPIQQVITSPTHSQKRGDFGLKSPLPKLPGKDEQLKHIVISSIDTPEGFTDFYSGASYYRTLSKIEELGVPVTVLVSRAEEKPANPSAVTRAIKSEIRSMIQSDSQPTFAARAKQRGRVPSLDELRKDKILASSVSETEASASSGPLASMSLLPKQFTRHSLYCEPEFSNAQPLTFAPKPYVPHPVLDRRTVAGNGGLSYALSNRAVRNPLGETKYRMLHPGRDLSHGRVTVAGIVAKHTNLVTVARQSVKDRFTPSLYNIEQLSVYGSGDVNMRVESPFVPVSSRNSKLVNSRYATAPGQRPQGLRPRSTLNAQYAYNRQQRAPPAQQGQTPRSSGITNVLDGFMNGFKE
ncbi:mitochondrial ribosomal protein MRP51 [Myxozyma melibiosi]|uniref:Mitochondrial ribosomal protein MRP51 n=1 Tax=Myxozyma melibiosi TaxID=54550 RepID=A0ABR1FFG8_9ASCO